MENATFHRGWYNLQIKHSIKKLGSSELNITPENFSNMKLFQKILTRINGLQYPQEYLCLASETLDHPLKIYMLNGDVCMADLTSTHCFVGYSPLIFAIPSMASSDAAIQIVFTNKVVNEGETIKPRDRLAILSMKKIHEQPAGIHTIAYFEGVEGAHRFIPAVRQMVIALHNRLYQKKPGNVFLPANLYKQVQMAYSVTRNISLITTGQDGLFNLFPTDLHGQVGREHYVISLRHQGKACQQVLNSKKILLSQVDSGLYKTVYALGKNHMQPLRPHREHSLLSDSVSQAFALPVPHQTTCYRELELLDTFTKGIHRVMLFRVIHQQQLVSAPRTLAHIHNVYATWRHNKGLVGNYLLR